MAERIARAAPLAILGLTSLIFAALSFKAVLRPLSMDELTAMANYPLANPLALFMPLPVYDQAAPPVFNLVCGLLALADPVVARVGLHLLITGAMLACVLAAFRSRLAAAGFLLVAISAAAYIQLSTELKYYGLDTVGAALALTWLVLKDSRAAISVKDLGILLLSAVLGISGIIIVPLVVATHFAVRVLGGNSLRRDDVLKSGLLLVCLALYYKLIMVGTSVQFANYEDTYALSGIKAVKSFMESLVKYIGFAFLPVLLASGLATLLDFRSARSQKLIIVCGLALGAFATLALVGKFPAVAARHVAWFGAFMVFVFLNAGFVLANALEPLTFRSRAIVLGTALVAAIASFTPVKLLLERDAYMGTDNRSIVAWLDAAPPSQIGFWIGGQAVVDYYGRHHPGLARHTYFGAVNARSAAISPQMRSDAFFALPYLTASRAIEAEREAPGAWGRAYLYRRFDDYDAPARTLLSQAPRNAPFYILASHVSFDASKGRALVRNESLKAMIAEAGCRFDVVLKVRGAYILRVGCGATDPSPQAVPGPGAAVVSARAARPRSSEEPEE